ncbi:hypothetical protein BGZ60DRAFT_527276 [Tricladium varicosporioides]|nr:hypothetical protein BGZ60DRAFT_527276 [Hymenoscyphus varicosporioides]
MPDPGIYADSSYHQFERRYIRKFAEKADIDKICEEKFDLYMNFMWGQLTDNVSGVEATQYLESKGVPVLLSPSDYIAKTKLDFQAAAGPGGFRVPGNTTGKYPKIIKYVDGLASIGMDYNSICYNEEQVLKRVDLMRTNEPKREILVQDFIRGIESTAIVVEMGCEVCALAPVDWIFDPTTPVDKAWLTYGNKFEALGEGTIHFQFITDEPRRTNICNSAVAAFKGLGMQGRGAWGRVDMRCEAESGDVYCLELNHMPALFYSKDDKLSDDVIIRETYPGGHEAFIEMLLFTKKCQIEEGKARKTNGSNGITSHNGHTNGVNGHISNGLDDHATNGVNGASAINGYKTNGVNGHAPNGTNQEAIGDFKTRGTTIAEVYDNAADKYDDYQAKMDIRRWQETYFATYDYSGTVLDLACGTGGIGMVIHQANPSAKVSGIDVSPLSLQKPYILKHYTKPISVGYMQNEIMKFKEQSFDHLVCFGALHFLNRTEFMATLSRMFMVARKSIAFDIDDVDQEYIDAIVKHFGEGLRNYNNLVAIQRFGVPNGWRKVIDERRSLFFSPSIHTDVYGQVIRFEKEEIIVNGRS